MGNHDRWIDIGLEQVLTLVRSFSRAVVVLLPLVLLGCGTFLRLEAPPAAISQNVSALGIQNERFWLDSDSEPLADEVTQMAQREIATSGSGQLLPAHFLALSGGGDNGAFGAGLMVGWTASGTRPRFNIVTGISAGALIAPFAFLGPDYDPPLRELFTGLQASDVIVLPPLISGAFSLVFGEALADTTPLTRLINRHANEAMLAAIAAEYAKGRLLLIGTTNLDLQRPVIWNIGAIAASGHPYALELFRSILLASASIPGAFPPVLVNVEYAGRQYQEMHVDGGAATQVFLYPASLNFASIARERGIARPRTVHVVRNGRVAVEAGTTTRGVLSITRRAASTLLHFSGISDINGIFLSTQRDGLGFKLAYIGADFQVPRNEPFDPVYMQALFDYGYEQGLKGDRWRDRPSAVGSFAPPSEPIRPRAAR